MVRVKNTHTAMVILGNAKVAPINIGPGGEVAIAEDDWASLLEHPAVAGRVRDGSLEVITIAKFAEADTAEEEHQPAPPKAKAKAKAKAKSKAKAKG